VLRLGEANAKSESTVIREYNSRGRYIKTLVPAMVGSYPFIPESLATGPDGKLYVLDRSGTRVQKFTLDGDFITSWGDAAPPSEAGDSLAAGGGIGITSKYVFTPDSASRGVKVWTLDGQPKLTNSLDNRLQNGTGRFQIAASARGELLVLDVAGTRVLRFHINF
jgi:hypothetical protein